MTAIHVRRRARLTVESLEERAVPAYAMTIDGDFPSFNVAQTSSGGVTTFRATGPGANVRVDELMIALTIENVVVTSGTGGGEDGSISWTADSVDDYPSDYFGPLHSLTFRPGSDATAGDVTLDTVILPFNDNVDFTIDTTLPAVNGDIDIANDVRIVNAHSLTLNAGTGEVFWESQNPLPTTDSGDTHVTAATFVSTAFGATLITNTGNLEFDAPIDVNSNDLALTSLFGTVTLNQPVDGPGVLTLSGLGGVAINADIGAFNSLDGITFAGGTTTYGSHSITATNMLVQGDPINFVDAILSGTGDLTGDLEVSTFGTVAPGGVGTIGAIGLFGNLTIDNGGVFALDVGATTDQIAVDGDVVLQGATLGGGGLGPLTAAGDVPIITLTGDVTGQFDNAPLGVGLFLDGGPIQVTNYGPAGSDITIAQILPVAGGVATGADADGTAYTVKLTGVGQLIAFEDAFNTLNLIVTGSTIKSVLSVTTKANASDDVLAIGDVRITGSLGGFTAPGGSVNGAITATGTIKAISVLEAFNALLLGGVATDTTTIKAANWFADINIPGILSTIKVGNDFFGLLFDAAGVGKATVGLILGGGSTGWNILGSVASLTAGQINGLDLTANFAGTITAKGDPKRHLSGDVQFSTFTLLGNDGNPKTSYGLKSLDRRREHSVEHL